MDSPCAASDVGVLIAVLSMLKKSQRPWYLSTLILERRSGSITGWGKGSLDTDRFFLGPVLRSAETPRFLFLSPVFFCRGIVVENCARWFDIHDRKHRDGARKIGGCSASRKCRKGWSDRAIGLQIHGLRVGNTEPEAHDQGDWSICIQIWRPKIELRMEAFTWLKLPTWD